jgi:hypothetical protein
MAYRARPGGRKKEVRGIWRERRMKDAISEELSGKGD